MAPKDDLQNTRLKRRIAKLDELLIKKRKDKQPLLGMSVMQSRLREQDHHAQFLGGRNCSRITVPILTLDQIKSAAVIFGELGEALEVCARQPGTQLGKVLDARNLCGQANRILKGGAAYKGAR